MVNKYKNVTILEWKSLNSEEAKGGNNENTSLWTNNLQDVLHIEPGDEVSVYQSYISERGAGQPETVEIKGVELGPEIEIQYINIKNTLLAADYLDNNLPFQTKKLYIKNY